jgi:hypothetical protein
MSDPAKNSKYAVVEYALIRGLESTIKFRILPQNPIRNKIKGTNLHAK